MMRQRIEVDTKVRLGVVAVKSAFSHVLEGKLRLTI